MDMIIMLALVRLKSTRRQRFRTAQPTDRLTWQRQRQRKAALEVAIIFQRLNSQILGAIVVLDIFATIGPDVLTYAVLGVVGSVIGSLVRIVRRDEADIENKIKFLYIKDVFILLVWALVGGFFPLVFAAQGWYPWLAVLCSPFTPKLWDVMESVLPELLRSNLEKFTGNGKDKDGSDKDKKKKEISE